MKKGFLLSMLAVCVCLFISGCIGPEKNQGQSGTVGDVAKEHADEGLLADGTDQSNEPVLRDSIVAIEALTQEPPKALAANNRESAANAIHQLFIEDDSIPFDPDTQTLIVINVSTDLSDHLRTLNLYGGSMEEMVRDFLFSFETKINGVNTETGTTYYVVSKDASSYETGQFYIRRDDVNRQSRVPVADITEGKESYIVIPLGIGDTYAVNPCEVFLRFGYFEKDGYEYGDIEAISPVPKAEKDMDGYQGTASSDVVYCDFSYLWDAFTFLEIELYIANPELKLMDMGGFALIGDSYAKYLIELKNRETGEISLLPKDVYFDIGQIDGTYVWMTEDGIVSIQVSDDQWEFNEERQQWGYWGMDGTIELRIPYGYDVRATVWEFGKNMGADAYICSQNPLDENGFARPYEGINYFAIDFMPVSTPIKIEKIVEGSGAPELFDFQATRNMLCYSVFDENRGYTFTQRVDYDIPLRNYPYRIYDSATDNEIEPETVHRTDGNGFFPLRVGEYVVFDTWRRPSDFSEYEDWSHVSSALESGMELLDRNSYGFEETTEDNCITSITLIRNEDETVIPGRKASECWGGDILNIYNTYEELETGSLTISKTVAGTAGDTDKVFTFTVTFEPVGTYSYTGSKTGTITSGGTVQLKHGESITITGLPAGVSYTVVESDNDGYEVTKTGDTGTITADATASAAFTNTKNGSEPPLPPSPPADPTGRLTISKKVTGELADTSKEFPFKVEFDASGTYSYRGSKSGKISSGDTVWLKHGEAITIRSLPAGTKYLVTETEHSGYHVESSNAEGTIAEGTRVRVEFINHKFNIPATGDDSNPLLWGGLMFAALAGAVASVVAFMKRRSSKGTGIRILIGILAVATLLGVGMGDARADTYTYGQYSMTYLPGTADTVTNMPANETGLTPGSGNPYTVSSTVPLRTGFEFIDWTLAFGTMEEPATPVDYSNALTVSKKATAAAAGDANTARAYTITLEAAVSISADDATGLYLEDLTVTDTIEDEFVLNSVRAEILQGGSVISSQTVSAGGRTVTYNFGNVEHGCTARLIMEVTAQSDFIGSNGVYTNVGESGWTYKHTDPEATTAETYSVTCVDKPQVNVPIRSFIVTQGTATQRMGLLLTVFATVDWIPTYPYSGEYNDFLQYSESDALLFTKYDQINGTVTHDKWIDPDEYPLDLNRAIHIAGGVPEDDVLYSPRNNWRVPTNHPLGDFPVYLYATFTPDEVTDGEFADATTAEPVGARTEVGVGLVTIIPRQADIEIIE